MSWDKFKYRYGAVVQTIALVLLVFLMFYVIKYKEVYTESPLIYAAKKFDLSCSCFSYSDPSLNFRFDKDGVYADWMPLNFSELNFSEFKNEPRTNN